MGVVKEYWTGGGKTSNNRVQIPPTIGLSLKTALPNNSVHAYFPHAHKKQPLEMTQHATPPLRHQQTGKAPDQSYSASPRTKCTPTPSPPSPAPRQSYCSQAPQKTKGRWTTPRLTYGGLRHAPCYYCHGTRLLLTSSGRASPLSMGAVAFSPRGRKWKSGRADAGSTMSLPMAKCWRNSSHDLSV